MRVIHVAPNAYMRQWEKHTTMNVASYEMPADLIYCGSVSQLDTCIQLKQRLQLPMVCWVWDLPLDWYNWVRNGTEAGIHAPRDEANKDRIRKLLLYANKIIVPTEYTYEQLINQGVDSDIVPFYIPEDVEEGVCERTKGKIVQVSRYATNKRFDVTVRALRHLEEIQKHHCEDNPFHGVFCGMGDSADLERMAKELGVQVRFVDGHLRAKVLEEMRTADIVVSPSVFEGWGISPLEAQKMGTPTVISDLPVFREYHDHWQVRGNYFHPLDDAEKMAFAIRRVSMHQDLRASRGDLHKLTPEAFAGRLEEVFSKILDRSPKGTPV